MNNIKKIIVIGLGSMGKRRLRHLKSMNESFEIIGAIWRHQEFFEIPFPDVRNLHGFGISGICRVPAVRNAQVVGVPNHFPIAVEAHNLAHSSVLYEILSVKIEF